MLDARRESAPRFPRPSASEVEFSRPVELSQPKVPGCRLCRALAHRLHPEPKPAPLWAVGSVTVDDLDRFAQNG
jgi:hypothetical protein